MKKDVKLDYRKYVIALRELAKVGPKGFQQLLLAFGSPENVFNVTSEQISKLPRMSLEKAEGRRAPSRRSCTGG